MGNYMGTRMAYDTYYKTLRVYHVRNPNCYSNNRYILVVYKKDDGMKDDETKKIPVVSLEISATGVKRFDSFLYEDEELECEYFKNLDGSGCINICKGNEPYSCHRSKKEGLCHECHTEKIK